MIRMELRGGQADLNDWLVFFLKSFERAIDLSGAHYMDIRVIAQFWKENRRLRSDSNYRQLESLEMVLTSLAEGEDARVTTSSWAERF